MSEKHPLHRKLPDLHTSEEVQRAVERKERRTEESVPNDPSARIEAYMDRLERVFLHPDPRTRERNLDMFRDTISDALIIKPENFPESYFMLQQRIARERGTPMETIPPDVRERMIAVAIADQQASLGAWITYLTSDDATYPPWFKYFVWRNITKLSQFDKERGEFKKRTDSTVARFPDIYRGALAKILDVYEKVKKDSAHLQEPEIREQFSKKFPTLYAELIQQSLAAQIENKAEIQGTWVKYHHNNPADAEQLYASLDNKGTGWCTEGIETAKVQIASGDFYVYYTNNDHGTPTQPRLAIRMVGTNRIAEVRGILPHQGVEPLLLDVLDTKLNEFGKEADVYRQKSADMRRMTVLDHKRENEEPLTPDDLRFLYEIDHKIQNFEYGDDPRVKKFRATRNVDEDMLVIFDCTKDDIAHVPSQITEHTKAYVGQLEPGIFDHLPSTVEHVYTKFPEGRIEFRTIPIGGKTSEQYERELTHRGHRTNDWSQDILRKTPTADTLQSIETVRLTLHDLGFTAATRYDTICTRARELGLDLAPAEVGPALRLAIDDQSMGDWFAIAMDPITGRDGIPNLFTVGRDAGGSWLYASSGNADHRWLPDYSFVFLRKQPIEHRP